VTHRCPRAVQMMMASTLSLQPVLPASLLYLASVSVRLEDMVTDLVEQLTEKQILATSPTSPRSPSSTTPFHESAELDNARWAVLEEMLREEKQARGELEANLKSTFSSLPNCAALALSVKAGERLLSAQLPAFAEDLVQAFAVLAAELKAEVKKLMADSEAKVQHGMKETQREVRDDQQSLPQIHLLTTQRFVANPPPLPVTQRSTYEGFGTPPLTQRSTYEGFGTPPITQRSTYEGFSTPHTPPLRQSGGATRLLVRSPLSPEAPPSCSRRKTISSNMIAAPSTFACGRSLRPPSITRQMTRVQPQSTPRPMTAQVKVSAASYGTMSTSSPGSAKSLTSRISGA